MNHFDPVTQRQHVAAAGRACDALIQTDSNGDIDTTRLSRDQVADIGQMLNRMRDLQRRVTVSYLLENVNNWTDVLSSVYTTAAQHHRLPPTPPAPPSSSASAAARTTPPSRLPPPPPAPVQQATPVVATPTTPVIQPNVFKSRPLPRPAPIITKPPTPPAAAPVTQQPVQTTPPAPQPPIQPPVVARPPAPAPQPTAPVTQLPVPTLPPAPRPVMPPEVTKPPVHTPSPAAPVTQLPVQTPPPAPRPVMPPEVTKPPVHTPSPAAPVTQLTVPTLPPAPRPVMPPVASTPASSATMGGSVRDKIAGFSAAPVTSAPAPMSTSGQVSGKIATLGASIKLPTSMPTIPRPAPTTDSVVTTATAPASEPAKPMEPVKRASGPAGRRRPTHQAFKGRESAALETAGAVSGVASSLTSGAKLPTTPPQLPASGLSSSSTSGVKLPFVPPPLPINEASPVPMMGNTYSTCFLSSMFWAILLNGSHFENKLKLAMQELAEANQEIPEYMVTLHGFIARCRKEKEISGVDVESMRRAIEMRSGMQDADEALKLYTRFMKGKLYHTTLHVQKADGSIELRNASGDRDTNWGHIYLDPLPGHTVLDLLRKQLIRTGEDLRPGYRQGKVIKETEQFDSAPEVLVLSLKRFNAALEKDDSRIDAEQILMLDADLTMDGRGAMYELCGVVEHKNGVRRLSDGSFEPVKTLQAGHYVAHFKTEDGKYFSANDMGSIQGPSDSDETFKKGADDAYMLYYRKKS